LENHFVKTTQETAEPFQFSPAEPVDYYRFRRFEPALLLEISAPRICRERRCIDCQPVGTPSRRANACHHQRWPLIDAAGRQQMCGMYERIDLPNGAASFILMSIEAGRLAGHNQAWETIIFFGSDFSKGAFDYVT
jgi:hypothetical protein